MAQKNEESYVVIGTKVSPWAYERLKDISDAKSVSIYEINQMMLHTIIRYMDRAHNLTPEMERVMALFEHMVGWRNALNLADVATEMEVAEATYYLQAVAGKNKERKGGIIAVHVTKPFFGLWQQTVNVSDIFDHTIETMFPERHVRLHRLAREKGCSSIIELIDLLLDLHGDDADVSAYRETFEDADRSDYGAKPAAAPYRRKMRKTMDSPGLFNDHDNEPA